MIDAICSLEFSYELMLHLPRIYQYHLDGKLRSTKSCFDMEVFYYFSPHHESFGPEVGRTISNKGLTKYGKQRANTTPESGMHVINDNGNPVYRGANLYKCALQSGRAYPPYREVYKNDEYVYDKPMIMLNNKKRDVGPHWTDDEVCEIIKFLSDDYQVVYNRPTHKSLLVLDSDTRIQPETEIDRIRSYFGDDVIILDDLVDYDKGMTYNTVQFKFMANCHNFINGGTGGFNYVTAFFGDCKTFAWAFQNAPEVRRGGIHFNNVFAPIANTEYTIFTTKEVNESATGNWRTDNMFYGDNKQMINKIKDTFI